MKLKKLAFALALCLSLAACQSAPAESVESPAGTETPVSAAGSQENPDGESGAPGSGWDSAPTTVLTCRIVDGAEDGNLLLAELGEGLYGEAGVYRLNGKGVPVTLDGKAADASVLEDGMAVDVTFNGHVLETFPAQLGEVYQIAGHSIGSEENPAGTCYDLCGLYLQVLDDLWKEDPGLNEGITLAGLDLSRAPGGLTESEKAALAWRFGELHGVEVIQGTFDELKEQGYFTATAISTPAPEEGDSPLWYQWEDGCLFSIKPNENHTEEMYSLPTLFFDAEKWRSPLGAYCFYDCSVVWPEFGTWSEYTIGSEMIS